MNNYFYDAFLFLWTAAVKFMYVRDEQLLRTNCRFKVQWSAVELKTYNQISHESNLWRETPILYSHAESAHFSYLAGVLSPVNR